MDIEWIFFLREWYKKWRYFIVEERCLGMDILVEGVFILMVCV